MFTNDVNNQGCDHNSISIVVEQEEIQQFDIDLENKVLHKIYDDINLTEPIMIVCSECKLELKYEDIVIEEFIATPLLDKEEIDVISYVSNRKVDESDGDDCSHDQVSLELYQLVQLSLSKNGESSYKIKETGFGEKEIYLTCDLCSTILYEYFDAELENLNNGDDIDDDTDEEDIFIIDDDVDDEDLEEDDSEK